MIRLLLIFVLSSLVLTACAQDERDGPPSGHVDISAIKNPKPRLLKRTNYGNPKEYTVHGKTYRTLKSPYGYHAVGYASWYGTKFNGHKTSSGERYDMYEMTAANKVLPIPCYVKVVNLNNHKSVIVKVNDRGPFHEGRIIDLSYVAALKLGIVGNGTAMVSVTAIDPRESVINQGISTLYVQAGAFEIEHYATSFRARVEKLTGQHTKAVTVKRAGKPPLTRIYVGPLPTLEKALVVESELKKIGVKHPITLTHLEE